VAALAAERGTGPLVPLALINGDLHVDGYAPPYSPTAVIAALLALIGDAGLSDHDIIERVGPPSSPTGCGVTCDHVALAAGADVTMVQTATMSYEERDSTQVVVLSNLPLGVGEWTVRAALSAKVEAMSRNDPDWTPHDYYCTSWETRGDDDLLPSEIDADPQAIPLADVRIEPHGQVNRIVCYPLPDAMPGDYAPLIASTWGVRTERRVFLPAPLPQLMRELVDDDNAAQRAALAQLTG
jgi:hypothetical protein